MAISWGSVYNAGTNKAARFGIEIVLSSDNTITTVTANLYIWTRYRVIDSTNSVLFNWNSTSASSVVASNKSVSTTNTEWSTSNQVKLASVTTSYTRGTSNASYNCAGGVSGIDFLATTPRHSVPFTIPAKPSYTVKYDANGGTGAPAAQTKWYGTNLTLSSTKPTRTGYTFQKWNTKADGSGTSYNAGAAYSGNAAVTLYAVWKADTYTVKYDANGGTGAPSNQTKTYGVNLTLSSTKPTRTNYEFKGWATSAGGDVVYAAGATYSSNAAVTLYAIWEKTYWKPIISAITVDRCVSGTNSTLSDEGVGARVCFEWETCQLLGANNVKTITVEWKKVTDTAYSTSNKATVSASGTSGSVNKAVGGAFDTDTLYDIRITVTDSKGGSTNQERTLPKATFELDIYKDSVAIGTVADETEVFKVAYLAKLLNGLKLNGNFTIDGDILIDDPELDLANDEVFAGHLIQNSQNLKHNQSRTSYALGTSCLDEYYVNSTTYWSFKEEDGIMVASATASGKTSDLYTFLCTPFVPIAQIPNGVEFSFWLKVDDVSAWDAKVPVQANLIDSAGSRFNYQSPSITHSDLNKPNVKSGEWVKIVYTLPKSKLETWTDFAKTAYVAFRLELARNGSIHFKLPDFRAI